LAEFSAVQVFLFLESYVARR